MTATDKRALPQELEGINAGYLAEQYERYLQDPRSVSSQLRQAFAAHSGPAIPAAPALLQRGLAVANLAQAIRSFGHLEAQLDPLGSQPPGDPSLEPEYHGLSAEQLRRLPAALTGGEFVEQAENAWEAVGRLRQIYCSKLGYEYDHVRHPAERGWLRRAAESGRFRPPQAPVDGEQLLERLTQVEGFERYLHRTFPGKIRFSIEGLDMLIPMLDELVGQAVTAAQTALFIGMAHRGRLNVLAHVLGKPYAQILAEFKDPATNRSVREELGWTGDVKYHKGARRQADGRLELILPPNPSHVEHVNPVVTGMARAAVSSADHPGQPTLDPNSALLILIHGDAAFPGEGVVAETLNLSRLEGYRIGGTIHIIANNQLGYTTAPAEARSTLYASDLAKGFKIPILHANADDPIACLEAARTASAYRREFQKDFVIDLVGYRRYGHNEGDEPSFTQPRMYDAIRQHPSVRELWAERMVGEQLLETETAEQWFRDQIETLRAEMEGLEADQALEEPEVELPPPGPAQAVETAVPIEKLRELNRSLLQAPEGFEVHPKLERFRQRRQTALDEPGRPSVDWATAEELAFASILADGTPIRISGEDTARGTFSQRHAVWHDADSGVTHTPLADLPQASAAFEVVNSPLTENATLAFEFGLNLQAPERLVIWEAQYGDFINAAQPMLDEFVLAGRAKWGLEPSLVILLPHGLEGQGPDHSSGRPERHLQLAADNNLRLVYPTTAAQYFHVLRRQAALLERDPLPLIVLTPKGLLRHPLAASPPSELSEGRWRPVLNEPNPPGPADQVERALLCSGRIYSELSESELRKQRPQLVLVRLEQLYPFPQRELERALEQYPSLTELVWVQEEPRNMGAWSFLQPRLNAMIDGRYRLQVISRPRNSSPAEGSASVHARNQQQIIREAMQADGEMAQAVEGN